MVFGAFDGLHPGHLDFFRQAKKFGDKLVVSVGRDKNVRQIKGKKPLFNELERLEVIGQLSVVDAAVLGAEKEFFDHIKQFAPDVICLGYDQWASDELVRRELDKVGLGKTLIYRLKPYKAHKAKSSIVKKKSEDFKKF